MWRCVDGPYKWRYPDASGASGPLFCGKSKSTSSGNEGGRDGDGGEGASVVGGGCWEKAKGVASAGDTAKAHTNDSRCGEDWASQLAPGTAEAQLGADAFDLAAQAPREEDEDGDTVVTSVQAEGKEETEKRVSQKCDLTDDDDFFEAMEDVHAWLGRILDH